MKNSGYAAVNGLSMYYEIHGRGNVALVLIHGGGSTIETSFSAMIPLLSANYKLIAVELQAHGRTSDRSSPETFQQDADDVAALLQHLGIAKANFFGFSNGGTTTLQIAIHHPAIVNKIIVVAGAYQREGFIPGFFESMQDATLDNMPASLQAAYLKVAPDKDGLKIMFEKDRQRMIDFKDIPEADIESIIAPALLMVADHDVITIEHTYKMASHIKGAKLVVLPGVHGSFIGEEGTAVPGSKHPQVTAMIIDEFLNE